MRNRYTHAMPNSAAVHFHWGDLVGGSTYGSPGKQAMLTRDGARAGRAAVGGQRLAERHLLDEHCDVRGERANVRHGLRAAMWRRPDTK